MSLDASSDSASNASSISLGVWQETSLPPDYDSEEEVSETLEHQADGEVLEPEPIPFSALEVDSLEYQARIERVLAEQASMQLWDAAEQDVAEIEDRYPHLTGDQLQQARLNAHNRALQLYEGYVREAGPAANPQIHYTRQGQILNGLYVTPIEEEEVEHYE
ncbi:hypothetical protein RSAG8_08509, partial [Rhizoctonia solani AG-8 WAC10335]